MPSAKRRKEDLFFVCAMSEEEKVKKNWGKNSEIRELRKGEKSKMWQH